MNSGRTLKQKWRDLPYRLFFWRNGLTKLDKITTHLTREEKWRLFRLVGQVQPQVIVEIGSYYGASASFLAAAIDSYRLQATLYCVDTWLNDDMPEGKLDTFQQFLLNTNAYADLIHPIRSKSVDAAKAFDQKIDILFIDGDHSYDQVKADWDHWSKQLSAQAVVVLHDIGWAEGVQRVVAEDIRPISDAEEQLPNLFLATLNRTEPHQQG